MFSYKLKSYYITVFLNLNNAIWKNNHTLVIFVWSTVNQIVHVHPQIDNLTINNNKINILTRKVIHGNTKLSFSLQLCQSIKPGSAEHKRHLNMFLTLYWFSWQKRRGDIPVLDYKEVMRANNCKVHLVNTCISTIFRNKL